MAGRNKRLVVNSTTKENISAHEWSLHAQMSMALREQKRKEGKKRWRERENAVGKAYMNSEHHYQLMIDKVKTGIKRTMLGRDAKLMNDKNKIKWMASIGTSKSYKSYIWVLDE